MGNSSTKDRQINHTTYHVVHRQCNVAQRSECYEDPDARVRIQEINEPPPSYDDSVNQRNYSPSAPCDSHSLINNYGSHSLYPNLHDSGSHSLYPNLHDSSIRNSYPITAIVPQNPVRNVPLIPPTSDKPEEHKYPEKINITSSKGSELQDESIDINYLLNLSTKEKSHVVYQMILHKNSFVKLLKDPLEYSLMLVLMKLVKKVCLSDILEKKIDVLKFVCCNNFFHCLGDYISDLPTHEQDTAQEDRLFLVESVVPFLESVCLLIPQECFELRDLVIKTSLSVQGMEQYRGMGISDDTKKCVQKMLSKLQGNVKIGPKEKSLSNQEILQKNNSSSNDSFENVLQYPCESKMKKSSTEESVIKDAQQGVVPKKGPLSHQGVLKKNRVKRDSVRHASQDRLRNKMKTLSTGEKIRENLQPEIIPPYEGYENIQLAQSDEFISSIHGRSFQVVLKVLSAFKSKKVRGMQKSFFFIDKVYNKKNNQNDEFLFALAQYLTKQQYDASNILILSTDEDDLQNALRIRETYKSLENISAKLLSDTGSWSCSIILMSLSLKPSLGTTKYIVDIFRKASLAAREGIFIIGNMAHLEKLSRIWSALNDYLQANEFISSCISLCCETHGAISIVNEIKDFKTHRNGGCDKDCNMKLACGHNCVRRCHTTDKKHDKYFCHKPCTRKPENCTRNHSCSKFCFENCGPCPCTVNLYGENMICHTLPQTDATIEQVGDQNSNNKDIQNAKGEVIEMNSSHHPKTNKSRMDNRLLPCGHMTTVFLPPFWKLDQWSSELVNLCQEPCSASLECGHTCTGTCGKCRQGRVHVSCQNTRKIRLACGHRIVVDCSVNVSNCNQKCFYQCSHSSCQRKCGELCTPCNEPCIRGCEHGRCTKRCSERCNWQPCCKPCKKLLSCGHMCVGYCGEPCPAGPKNCRQCNAKKFKKWDVTGKARFVVLEDCNHVVKGFELDQRMFAEHHKIEVLSCPICGYSINKTGRYLDYNREMYHGLSLIKHSYKKYCNELPDKFWNIVEEVKQFSLPQEIECSLQLQQMKEYTRLAASSGCIDEKSLILVQLVRNALCSLGSAPHRPLYWILTLLLYHYENGFSNQVLKELYRFVTKQQTLNGNLNKKNLLDLHLAISYFHMFEKDTWVRCPKGHVATYGSLITSCCMCD